MTDSDSIQTMGRSEAEIISRVRDFIYENLVYMHADFKLGDNDRLLERRVVDSMSITELVSFVESEFGVSVMEEEIVEANFGSLAGIARHVFRKLSGVAA